MAIINKEFNCEVCGKSRIFKYSENLQKIYGYKSKCRSCNLTEYNKNFNHSKRKYEIKDFFEKIDSNEKAYVFGFLWADGNLSSVIFDSSVFDKRTNKKYNRSTWIMNSKQVVMNFKKLNFRINLDFVPNEFHKDFLRGLIDGDGTFGYYDNDIKIKITSNYKDDFDYLSNISLLRNNFSINKYIGKTGKSTNLIITGSNVEKLNLLLDIYSEGFSMNRKLDKLKKITEDFNNRPIKYKIKSRPMI